MKCTALTLASGKVIKTAIAYIRVSTARENMKSPEDQLFICESYCADRGIRLIEPVYDLDLSGVNFAKRKIDAIIERVRNGEADAIVVWEYSRFGRTLIGSLFHIRELEAANGDLLSATQDIDATTPAGRYMRDQFLRLAEYQLDVIRANWKSAHARRRRGGLPHSGSPRFGYARCDGCYKKDGDRNYSCANKCDGVLVVEEFRGGYLKRAYERFVAGESFYRIARDAWEAGVRSLRGGRMEATHWRYVMDSGFAAGLLRGRSDTSKRPKNTRPDTYDIWSDGAQEALISQKLWDDYVTRRLMQADGHTRDVEPKYTLSSLIRCGAQDEKGIFCLCNSSVIGQSRFRKNGQRARSNTCKQDQYHASGKWLGIATHRAEELVFEWLLKMATNDPQRAQMSMERAAEVDKLKIDIKELRTRLASLKTKRARINEAYEAGLNDLDTAKERMAMVRTEIEHTEGKIRTAEKEHSSNAIPGAVVFQGLIEVWSHASPLEKNRALRKIIDHVRVLPRDLDSPASSGNTIQVIPLWADKSLRVGRRNDRLRRQTQSRIGIVPPDAVGDLPDDVPEPGPASTFAHSA